MKFIVRCGAEDCPNFWGFAFDNRKDAVVFAKATCFGRPPYRKITTSTEGVECLVDCRGCTNPAFGCSTCPKPDEAFGVGQAERLNKYFQEDI